VNGSPVHPESVPLIFTVWTAAVFVSPGESLTVPVLPVHTATASPPPDSEVTACPNALAADPKSPVAVSTKTARHPRKPIVLNTLNHPPQIRLAARPIKHPRSL